MVRRRGINGGGLRRLGLAAVGLVLVQATFGTLTVIFRLPMAVKTIHLGISMAFFCLLKIAEA